MNRTAIFVIIGLALMLGLYLYDRDNRKEVTFSALVIAVEARDPGDGPDTWHVTIVGAKGEVELEPLNARPDLKPGQQTCVTLITRMGKPDEYRWEPSRSC